MHTENTSKLFKSVKNNSSYPLTLNGQVTHTHAQGRQFIVIFDNILDRVSNSADNTVNHMHNSIGCNLVAVDNPGTVDCHHLCVSIIAAQTRVFSNTTTELL